MIIHSWGQTVTTHDSDGFHIYDRDATVRLKNGKCILEPGNSNNIFDLNANFLATRLDTDETEILGEDLTQCHQPKLQPCPRQAPRSSQPPWPSGDDQASAAQSGGLAGLAVM